MQEPRSLTFKLGRLISEGVHSSIMASKSIVKFVIFLVAVFGLHIYTGLSIGLSVLAAFVGYLLTGGWKYTWIVIRTAPRDGRGLLHLLRNKIRMKRYIKNNYTVPIIFGETVKRHAKKIAFMYENDRWTFEDVDNFSNAIANYFHESGYRKGDVICVYMQSRPEYVCLWLGLSKIGVIPALLNYNLKSDSLMHCINAADAKAVVYGSDLGEAIKDVQPSLSRGVQIYCYFGQYNSTDIMVPGAQDLGPLLKRSPTHSPPQPDCKFKDCLFYVYTSGTTGLPKAAVVAHSRYFYMADMVNRMFGVRHDDIVYDMLPLYHTAGGVLGTGQAILHGCTVVIRQKFSASQFWDDCVKYQCTVAQYIGEICRYLLAQPQRPSEKQHRVRMMFGNGLRPQIWEEFTKRFGIEQIAEFYGATEGNANVLNIDNTVGAVGFNTRIAPFLYPITLIKVDPQTGEPLRDRRGLCIKCGAGEPGELVGKIIQSDPVRSYDGYVGNTGATTKKVARDVFHRGDMAFLTGDLLIMDDYGNLFFKDRTGDTFRWRGENVSTSEVEATVMNIIKLKDAVVYGVDVPGSEGKAGMVTIVDEAGTLDLNHLASACSKALPPYARPLFVRIKDHIETTGTFKLKKVDLKKESYDPNLVSDRLYYLDIRAGVYKPLDNAAYADICSGKIRL
ncbi:long-chain fatty acid transport protein 4-like [Tubulanus polymorphus]|uniref:long-chain fatty acid transport protein 4-like n=1 Tax=Tubulanus polymorphus TaxID=672921 RepID=UPI003DA429B0